MSTRRRSSRRSPHTSKRGNPQRAKVVWLSLLAAMTSVGALLKVFNQEAPRSDNRMIPLVQVVDASASVRSTDSEALKALVPVKPLDTQRWTSIVIHHSGQAVGNAESIEKQHVAQHLEGLGHHFIINNGSLDAADGDITVGYRWVYQLPGAHAGGPNGKAFNQHAISICLVGDGTHDRFTDAEYASLTWLVRHLATQLHIPASHIYLYSDIAHASDPGEMFRAAEFREMIADLR